MSRVRWVWAQPPSATLRELVRVLPDGRPPAPCEELKHNALRTVWRVPRSDGGLIVKHYRERRGEGLKTALLGGRAEREFRLMVEFCRAGLPSARPVAWGCGADPAAGTWFVSREIEGARSLAQVLGDLLPDSEQVLALARRAMDLVVELHGHPFWHRDLHAGNLLLDRAGGLHVIDLHSVWQVPRLRRRQRLENLARLIFSLRGALHLERAPLLLGQYARARGESEAVLVRKGMAALDHFQRDWVRGRSARCLRNSSEFVAERLPEGRCHHRRTYSPERLRADLELHRRAVLISEPLLGDARASQVSRVNGDASPARVVKHYRRRGPLIRMRAWLRLGRARGAWRAGRRCLVCGVPTPLPLALLEQSDGAAWLVTEEVVGARDLTRLAQDTADGRAPLPVPRGALAQAVGHVLGRLSRGGLLHHDLSGKNVLLATGAPDPVSDLRDVQPASAPRLELIDLDNMRTSPPHDPWALARMLGQLGDLPGLKVRDRVRFERGFRQGSGRGLPPFVVARGAQLVARRQARRAAREAARRTAQPPIPSPRPDPARE